MEIECRCGKEMSCVFSWDVQDQVDPPFQIMVCGYCGYVCKEDLSGGNDVWLKAKAHGEYTVVKRKGPYLEIRYHCRDCEYHQREDGHDGRRYLCAEPTVVEAHGEPQYTCTSDAQAPKYLCPYRS